MMRKNSAALVPKIYDCVCEPNSWRQVLDRVVEHFGFAAANIFSGDEIETELNQYYISSDLEACAFEYFNRGYSQLDFEIYKYVPQMQRENDFIFETDLLKKVGLNGEQKSEQLAELHLWCQRAYGMHRRGAVLLNAKPNRWDFLALHFREKGITDDKTYIEELEFLAPHFSKVLTINRPFLLLQQRFKAVLDVLDRFYLGVVILNENGVVVVKNTAAEEIIDNADAINVERNGKLVFSNSERFNIGRLIHTIQSSPSSSGSLLLTVERSTGKDSYLVQVSNASSKDLDNKNYYLCLMVDPDNRKIVNTTGLGRVYQLTESEKDICRRVVDGFTNREIAELRNVSPETIKTQVTSLLAKLGCRNRIEVVNLAHTINIPIDSSD